MPVIAGQTFGRLTAVHLHDKKNGKPRWLCLCNCGNTKVDYPWNLRATSSCGCFSPNLKDLTGQIFGRLTVLDRASSYLSGGTRWRCVCSCGSVSVAAATNLTKGRTRSCGCYNDEMRGKTRTTHGHTTDRFHNNQSAEYNTWQLMKHRCCDPKNNRYYRYGARGITVCERWLKSFEAFLSDMGLKPTPQHSIDRINSDGNYEPTNCRWATRSEQRRNQSRYKAAHRAGDQVVQR